MATFTVVMRSITKGQAHQFKRCLLQAQNGPYNMTDMLCSSIGSHMLRNSLNKSLRTASSLKVFSLNPSRLHVPASFATSSNLDPQSQRGPHQSDNERLLYRNVPFPLTVRFERTLSTSVTGEASPSSQVSKDAPPDKSDSEDQSESKKDSKKESWWRGKNSWRLGLIFLGGTFITWGVGLVSIWGAPQLDPDGNEIQDDFSEMPTAIAYLRRTWKEMNVFKKKIQDPSRDLLLPDPLKYPYIQPPYTLVIELTGVLIHPDWTYSTGWRFKKRPGIDYFLQHVGPPLFEVVIYSQEAGMTADPLVNHLDPQGYIMYRLYRDATRYMEGKHVKDLSCLNREMSRIIMLDCSKDSVSLQPRNSLVLKKWHGEDADRTLIDLAHFLKTIAASGVEDIRAVLDYYNQFDEPLEAFKDNQRKLQEEEEARQKRNKEDPTKKKGWLSGFSMKR